MKEERVTIIGAVKAIELYNEVKNHLETNGFKIIHDENQEGFFDVKAHKGGAVRHIVGAVRDVEVMLVGRPGNYELTLRTGAWGRDIAIPAIEASLILDPLVGAATIPVEVLLARHFESNFWNWLRETVSRIGSDNSTVTDPFQPVSTGRANYCLNCGTKLPEEAKFCQRCGAKQA